MTKKVKKQVNILLTQAVKGRGKVGTLSIVKAGYARNYLIPKNIAELATSNAIHNVQQKEKKLAQEEQSNFLVYQQKKSILEQNGPYIIQKRSGEDNKIFGKITAKQLLEVLEKEANISLDKVNFEIPEIKELGSFEVRVIFHPTIKAIISLDIISQ